MADDRVLEVEREAPIVVLRLNRPSARNAVNAELREAMNEELRRLADDTETLVVILTGAGPAFCAGGDVRDMGRRLGSSPGKVGVDGWRRQRHTLEMVTALHRLSQVTIAALNGPAVGLGMDLALACDFIVAGPTSWMAASFVDRGLIPDGGSLYFLPRRVGLARAKELMFSGRRVDAAEAAGMGLVDVAVDRGEVLDAAREQARRFVDKSGPALMLMKAVLDQSFESPLETIGSLGHAAQAICYTTDEHRAAVQAFLAGRQASGGTPRSS
jgi:enoyl-CoA hydratase/carnithine racemase